MKKLRTLETFQNEVYNLVKLDNMLVQFNRVGVHVEGKACSISINSEDLIITKVRNDIGIVVYTDNLKIDIDENGEMVITTSHINTVILEKDERVIATTINGLVIPSQRNFNETHKESKVEEHKTEQVETETPEVIDYGVDIGNINLSNYKMEEEEVKEDFNWGEDVPDDFKLEEEVKEDFNWGEDVPDDFKLEEEVKEETEEETIARVRKEASEIFSEMEFGKGGIFDKKLDEWVGGGTKEKKDIIELINASGVNVVEKFVDHMKEVFIDIGNKIGLENCNDEAEKALFGQELRLALNGAKNINTPDDLEGASSLEEYVVRTYKDLRKFRGAFKGVISSELFKK